jgi:hypothetical protein
MTDYVELVERLRAPWFSNSINREAADAIEALVHARDMWIELAIADVSDGEEKQRQRAEAAEVENKKLREALKPLTVIVDRYERSDLDEHRPEWDERALDTVVLVEGRGGETLLTLQDCVVARKALMEENKKLQIQLTETIMQQDDEFQSLKKEVEKLREALKALFADFDECGDVGKHWDSVVRVRDVLGNEQEYARKLLGGREE